jgi:hypothetical protein
MSGRDSDRDDFLYLRAELGIDVELALEKRSEKLGRLFGQRMVAYKRSALHQNQMATDIEGRSFPRQANSIIESFTVRHQCSRSENPVRVSADDSGIHIRGEAKIVGIDDKLLQLEDA